tara:strand:- start:10259 stop:10912 length:654 start_codon:yes stop_codon:yes gene_type:complete
LKKYFVTGTGTGIGKTYVTCQLIRALKKRGFSVSATKPIISGYDKSVLTESDTGLILSALNLTLTQNNISKISPYRFSEPLSPDMAAARENRKINFNKLVDFSLDVDFGKDFHFIEGVGGILVPLTKNKTVLDWINTVNFSVILVAGSYLGTLSHTLSALHVLNASGAKVVVVVSESEEQPVPLLETVNTLKRFCNPVPVLGLSRFENARTIISLIT